MMLILLFLFLVAVTGFLSFGGVIEAAAVLVFLKIFFFLFVISLIISIIRALMGEQP